uniref:NADH-ubiquinone oxidoreductase chain 2 n=1 Tax=Somanniathelphusa bawangensis TaxID=2682932 RepID=A0A650FES0_9EUCA|nr:NADH dehydrogenase subunit 2 [Somanniathelphusa bawangensis]
MLFPISSTPFLGLLIMSTVFVISSSSWFGAWIGLELNMMSFIPLISLKMNQFFSESALKYFLIQALGSSLLIFASCLLFSLPLLSSPLLLSTLLLKLGSAPFHFWFPQIMEGLAWPQTILLMSIQKIAPMFLISSLMIYPTLIQMTIFSSILSALVGAFGGLNSLYLRKIMAFSSINHMSWMLISISISDNFWVIYFLFYTFISSSIVLMFNMFQAFSFSDLLKSEYMKFSFMIFFSTSLLSLGGLPPFTGFMPKWMLIQLLINHKLILPLMFLLLSALITLYFYLRILIPFILFMNPILNSYMKTSNSFYSSFMINLLTFFNFIGLLTPFLFLLF